MHRDSKGGRSEGPRLGLLPLKRGASETLFARSVTFGDLKLEPRTRDFVDKKMLRINLSWLGTAARRTSPDNKVLQARCNTPSCSAKLAHMRAGPETRTNPRHRRGCRLELRRSPSASPGCEQDLGILGEGARIPRLWEP